MSALCLMLFALSLTGSMIGFTLWGARLNRKHTEYFAHPRSAKCLEPSTSDALSDHCCECMADKL